MIFLNQVFESDEGSLLVWAEEWGIAGDIRKKYILQQLIYADNIFSRSAMAGKDLTNSYLWQIAVKEIETVKRFRNRGGITILEDYIPANTKSLWKQREAALYESFVAEDAAVFLLHLVEYYQKRGYGDFAFFPFFRWEQELVPIKHPDLVKMTSLLGYEKQKKQICRNTEGFLKGARANHVLLYGERGTGKSSTVKAVGTRYYGKGLRVVEIERHNLSSLPALLRTLEEIPLHFIVYIDDLSFDDKGGEYKNLKAVLEGSLAEQSKNILIYATSNRHHLIQESWKDRSGEDINVRENCDEMLSLSHRFGLTISFFSPDREAFLNIVEHLAAARNLKLNHEELRAEALQWVYRQHNFSGRTAVQFINDLEIRLLGKRG